MLVSAVGPAAADPGTGSGTGAAGGNPDGADSTPPSLRDRPDQPATAYDGAQGRLEASEQRQAQLALQITLTEQRLAGLVDQVGTVAAAAYRGSRLSTWAAMLNSRDPESLLAEA